MSKSKALQGMYDRHYDNIAGKPYEGRIEQVYEGLLESVRRVDNFSKPESQIQEQIVYKLLHKDSGLYFDPQGRTGNVSEMGKVYSNKKPARQSFIKVPHGVDIKTGFDLSTLNIKSKFKGSYNTKLDDWVVEEFKLVKVNKGE